MNIYNPFTSKERPPKEKILAAIILVLVVCFLTIYLQVYFQQQAQLEAVKEQLKKDCSDCVAQNAEVFKDAGVLAYTDCIQTKSCPPEIKEACPVCYPEDLPLKGVRIGETFKATP